MQPKFFDNFHVSNFWENAPTSEITGHVIVGKLGHYFALQINQLSSVPYPPICFLQSFCQFSVSWCQLSQFFKECLKFIKYWYSNYFTKIDSDKGHFYWPFTCNLLSFLCFQPSKRTEMWLNVEQPMVTVITFTGKPIRRKFSLIMRLVTHIKKKIMFKLI